MRFLLDTHVVIWWAFEFERISQKAQAILKNSDNEIVVSVISAWEIAIKAKIEKITLSDTPDKFFVDFCRRNSITVLPVYAHHALETYNLPLLHRDPFDRILIAQAKAENLTLITGDPLIRLYEVTTLW